MCFSVLDDGAKRKARMRGAPLLRGSFIGKAGFVFLDVMGRPN